MAFTGSNAPNGLGNSPVNNSSKAWYQAGNDSFTSRTSLRQDAQAPSQKGRQQGGLHWPSWWVMYGTPALLIVVAGLSLAVLGAHDDGMARCYRSDVKVTGPHSPAEEHVDYDIVAGYVKGHYDMTAPAPKSGQHRITLAEKTLMLRDLAAAGHASTVLGAFVCVMAVVSALSALALLLPLAKWGVLMVFRASAREEMPKHAKRALGPYLWPTAFLNMMLLMAILIAFYIVVAVGVAATTSAGTQHVSAGTSWKCIPHPSWAWWLGMVASAGWVILGILGWHEERAQMHGTTMATAELSMQRMP
ncbi:g1917 [Coccomyxa viridis]|uniref:G1917 protein n=1 Tax=Coccomyxa viridis TaxID=1274662 RepID=A0ABP1FMV9_9CHLO